MRSLVRRAETRAPDAASDSAAAVGVEAPRRVGEGAPRPLGRALWDWPSVRRVLVVRLRSIGDTVLATPSLHALRRFLPEARLDILLEDWGAPPLEGSGEVDRVLTVERASKSSRLRAARQIRAEKYDVVY